MCYKILWLVALPVACVLAITGCGQRAKPDLRVTRLGSFHVDHAGGALQGEFAIPEGATQSLMGFTLRSGTGQTDTKQIMLAMSNLASGKLRLSITLSEKAATEPFYKAEFPLGQDGRLRNYCYLGFDYRTSSGYQYVFTGIEPLSDPRTTNLNSGIAGTYPFGREKLPVHQGRLLPGVDCKVTLKVLEPLPITNEFQLWLYSICNPSSSPAKTRQHEK